MGETSLSSENLDGLLQELLNSGAAQFRELEFYDLNEHDTIIRKKMSQRDIISDIISSSLDAVNGKEYKDFFITSSTGSGKSILFQLPSYYFSRRQEVLLTIVVTPLIALMHDQVQSIRARGHDFAAYIDSTCSANERNELFANVRKGKVSLLYAAPETLVSLKIDDVIGNRKIGLFVIDEAHTVTTWGRDFRPHYWFLVDFLRQLRKSAKFPVLCLTATAVYGGKNDMVKKTIEILDMHNTNVHIGIVRRSDIRFEFTSDLRQKKTDVVKERIRRFVNNDEKTIVYFPYTSQITSSIPRDIQDKISIYHGSLSNREKDDNLRKFRDNETVVMLCTKAFGMGVDISDIVNCYHYAPTGEIEDYVQEVGRCARKEGMQGTAYYDYTGKDIGYIRSLHYLSALKKGQVSNVIYRLVHEIKNRPNSPNGVYDILLSPEEFRCFGSGNPKTQANASERLKLCLLLISDVVNASSGRRRMTVYPGGVNTTCLVFVSNNNIDVFSKNYKSSKLVEENYNEAGNLYELDLEPIWQAKKPDGSFSEFKTEFFSSIESIFRRYLKLEVITEIGSFDELFDKYREYTEIFINTLSDFKKPFIYDEFENKFVEKCKDVISDKDTMEPESATDDDAGEETALITSGLKTETEIESSSFADIAYSFFELFLASNDKDDNKIFRKVKTDSDQIQRYKVIEKINYSDIITNLDKSMHDMLNSKPWEKQEIDTGAGNAEVTAFTVYVLEKNKELSLMSLEVLRILDLLYYRVGGGTNAKMMVKIRGRIALYGIKKGCHELIDQNEERFERSTKFLDRFLRSELTSEQRWDIIEHYFLGNSDAAERILEGAHEPDMITMKE